MTDNNTCTAFTKLGQRCKRKSIKDHELCKQHLSINKKEVIKEIPLSINDEYLDSKFKHNLLSIYDTWKDVPINMRILFNGEWWPINLLINMFTEQLNCTKLENPYPRFPSNPFTREVYPIDQLLQMKEMISKLNYKINIVLKHFLNLPLNIMTKIYNEYCITENSFLLRDELNHKFRFKMINSRDSQNCCIGYWSYKNDPITQFEKLLHEYYRTPLQIISAFGIFENPLIDLINYKMNNYPEEFINLYDDSLTEFI